MSSATTHFGSCCKDLADCMNLGHPGAESFFFVESNGVLFLTVGRLKTVEGTAGYLDHAVLFCPFCGTRLQDKDEIARRAKS